LRTTLAGLVVDRLTELPVVGVVALPAAARPAVVGVGCGRLRMTVL
jgi:hypothetical protein